MEDSFSIDFIEVKPQGQPNKISFEFELTPDQTMVSIFLKSRSKYDLLVTLYYISHPFCNRITIMNTVRYFLYFTERFRLFMEVYRGITKDVSRYR